MQHIYAAFLPCRKNYVRWAWCIACAIPIIAWINGASSWALVAAFNALAMAVKLSTND